MLERQPEARIALWALQGEDTEALIGEAVFWDGELVGLITSAAYGHSVDRSLAIEFIKEDARAAGTRLRVSLLGWSQGAIVLPAAP